MYLLPQYLQNEPIVSNVEDLFRILDRHIMDDDLELAKSSLAYTKMRCFAVLASYYRAGKLLTFQAEELESAVNLFLVDRLWLSYKVVQQLEIPIDLRPQNWLGGK